MTNIKLTAPPGQFSFTMRSLNVSI